MSSELEIIYGYQGVAAGEGNVDELRADNFKRLRSVCEENGFAEGKELDAHLEPFVMSYMTTEFNDYRTWATKKGGKWNVRKFYVPLSHEYLLKNDGILYKVIERTVTRKGIKTTESVCQVCGIPDGFYSAWKTLCRAMDNGIPNWHTMGKSEIDKAISANNAAIKAAATNPIDEVKIQYTKYLSSLLNLSCLEDKESIITDCITELEGIKDEITAAIAAAA